jgi:hypothetical protein
VTYITRSLAGLRSCHSQEFPNRLFRPAKPVSLLPALRNCHIHWPECAGEVRAAEARAGELRTAEVRAVEVRAGEVRVVEVRAGEVCVVEVRAGEVRVVEARAVEVRVVEVRACEVRVVEERVAEVRAVDSALSGDGGDEFSSLFPPHDPLGPELGHEEYPSRSLIYDADSQGQRNRKPRTAASAPLSDDDLYAALFPPECQRRAAEGWD